MFYRLFLALLLVLRLSTAYAQFREGWKTTEDFISILNKNHVAPISLHDSLSKKIFYDFVAQLDPYGIILSLEELEQVKPDPNELLDRGRKNDFTLILSTGNLWVTKLKEYQTWLTLYLNKPLPYSSAYVYNPIETYRLPETERELLKSREVYIIHTILERLYNRHSTPIDAPDFPAKEAKVRESILNEEIQEIKKILNHPGGIEDFLFTQFLKSIASQYDPHTEYLTALENEEFESSISKQALSFGIELSMDDRGNVVISRIIPASPAWDCGQINKGDLILGIEDIHGNAVDFTGQYIEVVKEIMNSTDLPEATIFLQKQDGQVKSVKLYKKKLEHSENVILSFVLKGERKIGYIQLPSFYEQWENEQTTGCANDVAKELLKLKNEKIEGLIVDLRYNGGGSLAEALNLMGIFIDYGPLAILHEAHQEPYIAKDSNKGTIYDGPLAIMVNGLSASASELFCATLQDYNRAIVVGSPTFGKSTGQIIHPLGPGSIANGEQKDKGFAKITIEKIYRITGKSYQNTGVIPDIHLPDFTESLPIKERFQPNSLPNDSLAKKTYYKPLPHTSFQKLRTASEGRVKVSPTFELIRNLTKKLLAPQPLRLPDYAVQRNQINNQLKLLSSETLQQKKFDASVVSYDAAWLTFDKDRAEQLILVSNELQQSVYINEVYQILVDVLKQ